MIDIRLLENTGNDEIRDYLFCNRNTLIYSEPRFLDLISNQLNAKAGWIEARRDGQIVGLLPYLSRGGPLGLVYNSLAYYGSNGGVIQSNKNEVVKKLLTQTFYQHAMETGAASATLVTNPLEGDANFYEIHTGWSHRDERIGQITHFPSVSDGEDLFDYFQSPRPRNIRRAIKEGVIVEKGGAEAIDFLFKTHSDNMSAIGGFAKKRSFFENISDHLDCKDWAIYTATLNEKPIAALLLFYFNETVEYFTPVVVAEFRNTQALSLIIYSAMEEARETGYKNWNWGGTWLTQDGVYDFKKRWGTSEYRYYYFTKVFNNEILNSSKKFLQEEYFGFFTVPYKYCKTEG